ncbi:MAG: class II glutamine amidotransferase [Spirochaetes bacterium]|nr:class II glutamine amidotransferase [Spirochaetota bacterium]
MCQLLGIGANRPVDMRLSLREFRHRGAVNSHGWGFAFREGRSWRVIKRPVSLAGENTGDGRFDFTSPIVIGHVRLATCGNHTHPNTHPFALGKWAFAHNGTVEGIMGHPDFRLARRFPKGGTDSEYAFCRLVEAIEEAGGAPEEAIAREAARIRAHGRFNFLLSDGKRLYAHGHDSLFCAERSAPFPGVRLVDDGYEADLAEIKARDERAVIIATEPLTEGEEWTRIEGLRVFGW